jgi:hypothetical protein
MKLSIRYRLLRKQGGYLLLQWQCLVQVRLQEQVVLGQRSKEERCGLLQQVCLGVMQQQM